MCWSAEVSFGFGLAQWLGVVYLLRRKQHHDAWYVVALVPLAIQETMQFLGWLLVNREGNDAFTCGSLNKVRLHTCAYPAMHGTTYNELPADWPLVYWT
jgi:hypothetical protein